MELIWNHRFGQQEQQPLVICRPWAFAEEHEDGDMLQGGWLLLDHPYRDKECWYQSRSVRIDLDRYSPRFPKHQYNGKEIEVKEIFPKTPEDLTLLPLKKIYTDYLKRKGFRDLYDPFTWLGPRTSFLLFSIDSNIKGFTKMRRYYWQEDLGPEQFMFPGNEWEFTSVAGIESVLHASAIPISAVTADLEIQWAQQQGAGYIYLGAGYERSSEYKSAFRGFEWWTGEKWSRLKKPYRKLCKRDSDLELISDLRSAK